jgi:hypothetical protein
MQSLKIWWWCLARRGIAKIENFSLFSVSQVLFKVSAATDGRMVLHQLCSVARPTALSKMAYPV